MEEIEKLNEQYVKLKESMSEKADKKKKLEKSLNEAKNELEKLGITKANYKDKTIDEQKQWKAKNGEVSRIKNELQTLKVEIDNVTRNIKELKKELIEMFPEIKEYVDELTKKADERKIKDIEEKKKSLEEKVNILKSISTKHPKLKEAFKAILFEEEYKAKRNERISQLQERREKYLKEKKELENKLISRSNKSEDEIKQINERLEQIDRAMKMDNAELEKLAEENKISIQERKDEIYSYLEENNIKLSKDDIDIILNNSKKILDLDKNLNFDEIMDKNIAKLDKSIANYDKRIEKIRNVKVEPKNANLAKEAEKNNGNIQAQNITQNMQNVGTTGNQVAVGNTNFIPNMQNSVDNSTIEQSNNNLQKVTWYNRIGNGFKKVAGVLRHPIQAIKNRLSRDYDDIEFIEEPLEGEPKETEKTATPVVSQNVVAVPNVNVIESDKEDVKEDTKSNMNAAKFREALQYDIVKDVSKELSGGKLNLEIKPKDQSKGGNARQ